MPSSLVLLPFFAVIILNLPLRNLMRKVAFWFCLTILAIQIAYSILPITGWSINYLDTLGSFLKLNFAVDTLSRLVLLSIGIVLFATLCVQKYIISDEDRMFNFVNVLLLLLSGINGLVMVQDIFSLYVFLEITSINSFILIGFNKDIDAFEAAFKYIIFSVIATILLLSSIALLVMFSGSTNFTTISIALAAYPDKVLITFAIALFLCASFIKAGLIPFHGWLPDAYQAAPTSTSILLAGVVTKTVGIYTIIRIINSIFGWTNPINNILLVIGIFSIIVGALATLKQNDFKRILAYSSISQVGYIVLGLGAGTTMGLVGAIFHLFNHSIFKSLLFVNAAAVEIKTNTTNIDSLSGLAKKMPLTGITSIIASLSCAGIPPLAGFWSKLIIIMALWMAGHYVYAVIAILASVLTLGYFLLLQKKVFFGLLSDNLVNIREAGFGIIFPALILSAITIGVGIFFPFLLNSFILPLGNF